MLKIGPIVILTGRAAREYKELKPLAEQVERDAQNLENVVRRLELIQRAIPAQEKKP